MPSLPLRPSDIGRLVTVRAVTRVGPVTVVGTLVAVSADEIVVRRRDGVGVQLDVTNVTHARVVPPSPAQRIPVADLERLMLDGWRARETERLGGWVLRATRGFTRRANSGLPLGDPGVALDEALAAVEAWYDARALPPRLQLPAGVPDGDALAAPLRARGWTPDVAVHVMTAGLGPVVRSAIGSVEVRLDPVPDDAWLAAYRRDGGPLPPVARELLTNHPQAVFASVRDGAECLAVARATVDGRWAGLFAVEVAPTHRRGGLARAVSVEALRWAVRQGGRHAYLQAEVGNDAAVSLYTTLGFTVHHDYEHHVRLDPAG